MPIAIPSIDWLLTMPIPAPSTNPSTPGFPESRILNLESYVANEQKRRDKNSPGDILPKAGRESNGHVQVLNFLSKFLLP